MRGAPRNFPPPSRPAAPPPFSIFFFNRCACQSLYNPAVSFLRALICTSCSSDRFRRSPARLNHFPTLFPANRLRELSSRNVASPSLFPYSNVYAPGCFVVRLFFPRGSIVASFINCSIFASGMLVTAFEYSAASVSCAGLFPR